MTLVLRLAAAVLAGGLGACASVPNSIVQQPTSAAPRHAAPAPAPPAGTIFQAASYRPLFEERRARRVGDTLLISVEERTSASKNASSGASKSGSVQAAAPVLANKPLNFLGLSASSARKFEDKTSGSAGNSFSSAIAVTVVDVLANGNLLVSGEKQVAMDKGTEFIRFSGVVDPVSIAPGNVVSSTVVADARIEYRTSSRIDKAEMMGSLTRFFFSVLPL